MCCWIFFVQRWNDGKSKYPHLVSCCVVGHASVAIRQLGTKTMMHSYTSLQQIFHPVRQASSSCYHFLMVITFYCQTFYVDGRYSKEECYQAPPTTFNELHPATLTERILSARSCVWDTRNSFTDAGSLQMEWIKGTRVRFGQPINSVCPLNKLSFSVKLGMMKANLFNRLWSI